MKLLLAQERPLTTEYGTYYDLFGQSSGYCQVHDAYPPPGLSQIVVACRGEITSSTVWQTFGIVTEYAAVHEFGHVLDIQSDTALRDYVGNGASLNLQDCTGARVLGTVAGETWARGQRGWGTASVNPNPPPNQRLSQFQQNPAETDVETAADMFLNWVYRRTTDTAPSNIPIPFDPLTFDAPAPIDACNYAQNGAWQGFKNIREDGSTDTRKPGNVRYWWIEGTLDRIARDRGWK